MALTDYDKKNLSTSDQQKIEAATKKWNEANAKGDKAGMQAAANEAAAVRNNAKDSSGNHIGYKTDSSGAYTGSYTPTSSGSSSSGGSPGSNTNSPTTNVDWSAIGMQQMAEGASWQDVYKTYNERQNKINNDPNLSQYANDDIQLSMLNYINNQKALENQQNFINDWYAVNQQPTYNAQYDPQMQAILNEILNRDNFSYDAMNDPLYQQYATMYQREGDRAMQETLAEAAAGAGGMNSYAITAAQQANNYYNSQLNDKIPELYQLAYDMYLNDIDSKVRDLGLLQNMDATQYARYQDTMNNWYNDRNFAYGAYQDAINQGNWQTQFDYNSMIDNRDFNYNDYWKNKEFDNNNYWVNKEWDTNQSRYDTEIADAKVQAILDAGGTVPDDLIAQSSWTKEEIEAYTSAVKAGQKADGEVDTGDKKGNVPIIDDDTGTGTSFVLSENAQKLYDSLARPTTNFETIQNTLTSPIWESLWVENENGESNGKAILDKLVKSGKITREQARKIQTGDSDWQKGVSDLGLGLATGAQLLVQLDEAGAIYEDNGTLKWNEGWNVNNYQQKLNAIKSNTFIG